MPDLRKIPPPRGALIVIAVGLFATVVAALLSTDKLIGATTLEWVEEREMPDARPAPIPGGGEIALTNGLIRETEPNVSEYTLYQTSARVTISAGSAVGQGRLRCKIAVPKRTIVAKTHNSRASYPRSSDELSEQETPEEYALVEFSSHSTDYALVEISDQLGKRYTRQKGIVGEWAPFRIGQQVWQWSLPRGRPSEDLSIPFASIWRTTAKPAGHISCTIETSAGSATVATAGSLPGG